jgi:hypothetical protein
VIRTRSKSAVSHEEWVYTRNASPFSAYM